MTIPLSSEALFWGGILLMAAALLFMAVALVVFGITRRRLKKQLEEEYGKPYR